MTGAINIDPRLHPSWKNALAQEFQKSYFAELKLFLLNEKTEGREFFPKGSEIFTALNLTPLNQVRVVILGQDPYHGPGQAHGLSFSVRQGQPLPPSLQNIFREISQDLRVPAPTCGDLSSWAKQGVLLLNTVLTVQAHRAGSHRSKGWEQFTDAVIDLLNQSVRNLVFLLWGKDAREKSVRLDGSRHLILTAPHPSPLSAHRGFLGCGHFSKANRWLEAQGSSAVSWSETGG